MDERLENALIAAFFFLVFGILGTIDYEEAIAQDEHYAEMVCNGHWPNYDQRQLDCTKVRVD